MAKFFDFSNIRGDIYGGITAGIIALPLALAFGETSGAGPIAGLWGAIIVGFFAALFGGTGSQVSGPTGPMVVVFAGIYGMSESPEIIFAAVVGAGLLQILFGVFRLGDYIRLVPYPVISGFMSGIGVIIIALQVARLFGHEPTGGGTIPALIAIPDAVMAPNLYAFGIAAFTLLTVFIWPKSWGRFLPAPLFALVAGTVMATYLPNIPILGDIPSGLPEFIIPMISEEHFWMVAEAAFILALLGTIDSLLTSLVADNMTRTRHSSNKELVGQGIGNSIAGLFGAIPGAGATMRTVVNIKTGGSTKISGMLHAAVLLLVALSLGPLAENIPHAVLAGILVKVGYDIIDFRYLKRAHKGPRWDLILMLLVLGLTVFVDLITAVLVGVVLAALAFVKQMADTQLDLLVDEDACHIDLTEKEQKLLDPVKDRVTLFNFEGPFSFGAAADIVHRVRTYSQKNKDVLILDFEDVPFIDVSAAQAIETIVNDAKASGSKLLVCDLKKDVIGVLVAFNVLDLIPQENRFKTRPEAIKAAADYLQK